MAIEIIQIGITAQKERTWGRVYIDYVEEGIKKFIFKNWIKFEEKNYNGEGSFENDPAYTWFDKKETEEEYDRVLDGEYDNLHLTNSNHQLKYGTPSIILKKLISDLDQGLMDDINKRRGWFNE